MKRTDDVVSASEIASWAWCPESWRLSSLGHEPGNRAALERGRERHARTADIEARTRATTSLGWWLLAAAIVIIAVAALLLAGG